jgi:hypothetical protein
MNASRESEGSSKPVPLKTILVCGVVLAAIVPLVLILANSSPPRPIAATSSAVADVRPLPPRAQVSVDFNADSLPDAAVGCAGLVVSSRAGTLYKLDDAQLERGLCLVSKATVSAMSHRNRVAETQCTDAMFELGREFARRFPNRPMRSVTSAC